MSSLLAQGKSRIELLEHERKYVKELPLLTIGRFLYKRIEDLSGPSSVSAIASTSAARMDEDTFSEVSIVSQDDALNASASLSAITKQVSGNTSRGASTPATPSGIPKKPSSRKTRAPVDPDAPKRPANAFMLFCDLNRDAVKAERNQMKIDAPGSEEDAGLANITKALGSRWKGLADDEKQSMYS